MRIPASEFENRNQPCPCGSGKKYKKCCMPLDPGPDAAPVTAPIPRGPNPLRSTERVEPDDSHER